MLILYQFVRLILDHWKLTIRFFFHLTAPFARGADIQVWIQTVKIEDIWRFHDGSLVPDVFDISMSNNAGEIDLRAKSNSNFIAVDAPDSDSYSYVCEFYR